MSYELISDYSVGEGKTYSGPAEICYFWYNVNRPDQMINQSMINQLVESSIDSVHQDNGVPLRVTVYEDAAGTSVTKYQVAITAHGKIENSINGIGFGPLLLVPLVWAVIVSLIAVVCAGWLIWNKLHSSQNIEIVAPPDITPYNPPQGTLTKILPWILVGVAGLLAFTSVIMVSSGRRNQQPYIRR